MLQKLRASGLTHARCEAVADLRSSSYRVCAQGHSGQTREEDDEASEANSSASNSTTERISGDELSVEESNGTTNTTAHNRFWDNSKLVLNIHDFCHRIQKWLWRQSKSR
jgi:hypothetical protein